MKNITDINGYKNGIEKNLLRNYYKNNIEIGCLMVYIRVFYYHNEHKNIMFNDNNQMLIP